MVGILVRAGGMRMRERFKHLAEGCLLVRMRGLESERFLNLCMTKEIEIWNICSLGECQFEFWTGIGEFRRMRPLARKAGVRLLIKGRRGLPFFLYRNRRRKLYVAGLSAFFLILFLMSQFVWNISLEGNLRFTDDTLLHYLNSIGISCGMPRARIDCSGLEESIRESYPEIIWVSARVSGTRLLIRIKENEGARVQIEENPEPCDLSAEKGGIVTSILVRNGRAQVCAGDEIKADQVVVSGRIPIFNDNGEISGYHFVHADADIRVRTHESWEETVEKTTRAYAFTGHERKGIRLRIGGISFMWMLPSFHGEWEFQEDSEQLALIGDFYLPVVVDRILAREYVSYERNRTQNEVEELKNQINRKKIQNFTKKGVQIFENNVKIQEKTSCYLICGELEVEEPIGTERTIQPDQELKSESESESRSE